MKKTLWSRILFILAGLPLLLFFLTFCSKTEYELLDPESAGVWTQFKSETSGLPGNHVWDIELDGNDLWVSFLGNGVGVCRDGDWTFYNDANSSILNDYITDLELIPGVGMMMGTADGLALRTTGGEWYSYIDESVSQMDINVVKYTSQGDIWLGTDGEGVYIDEGSGFFQYKYADFEYVNAIEEDSRGNVWLGTKNGLLKYDGSSLYLEYTTENGLPANEVTALYSDHQNRLWVGTNGGAIVSWITSSGEINQLYLRDGEGGNYIKDIYQDRQGDMWFATWGCGLVKYDGVVPHSYKKYNGFFGDDVNCINEDNAGNIWYGLWNEGLVRYRFPLD